MRSRIETTCAKLKNVFFSFPNRLTSDEQDIWHLKHFSVEQGDQLVVTGPSGCGKSTLLNVLSGLVTPSRGEVEVCDEKLHLMNERSRDQWRGREIGMIFQTYQLFNEFSALENVLMGALFSEKRQVSRDDEERARELLDQVGLSQSLNKFPTQMSIGQQQRVAIARALIKQPRLILADEPTGALDSESGREVFELLSKSARELNASLIVVTHDMELARTLPIHFDASDLLSFSNQRTQTA